MELWKPLIAAVNGIALGMGLEIVLACDIRIVSENARLGLPEVTLGLMPGQGGTQRLARMIPWCYAAEMILAGRIIDAEKAERIGLVNEVVAPGELMSTARKWAERICRAGPLAVRAAKEAMIRGYNSSLNDGVRLKMRYSPISWAQRILLKGSRPLERRGDPFTKGSEIDF
jgi:enoyl-CoA hydratase/carnithine racemase